MSNRLPPEPAVAKQQYINWMRGVSLELERIPEDEFGAIMNRLSATDSPVGFNSTFQEFTERELGIISVCAQATILTLKLKQSGL